jgi:hypothetical protein
MLVTLPSGAIAPLEVPGLPSLLAAGGDLTAIAACSFAHDEVTVDELYDSDVFFVAAWALEEFTETEDALELAIVSEAWHRSPSDALGLSDRPLAWGIDRALYLRFAKATKEGGSENQGEPEDGAVRFTREGVT